MGHAIKSRLEENIAAMTGAELDAFYVVINCLECPSSDLCLTAQRLYQTDLWQLADVHSITRKLAQECQRRFSSPQLSASSSPEASPE